MRKMVSKLSTALTRVFFSLKKSIKIYFVSRSPVFVCSLNAAKIFATLSYETLFEALTRRDVPNYTFCILSF